VVYVKFLNFKKKKTKAAMEGGSPVFPAKKSGQGLAPAKTRFKASERFVLRFN
jgi:hypothetical protein